MVALILEGKIAQATLLAWRAYEDEAVFRKLTGLHDARLLTHVQLDTQVLLHLCCERPASPPPPPPPRGRCSLPRQTCMLCHGWPKNVVQKAAWQWEVVNDQLHQSALHAQ